MLDAVIAGTVMLRRLSPNLDALVSGNVYDHGQYDQLLGIGFASPSFEQDVSFSSYILKGSIIIHPHHKCQSRFELTDAIRTDAIWYEFELHLQSH